MTVKLERDSRLLRIFIGEMDKYEHQSLYEALVFAANEQGIAGATVLRGILAYGASSRIHTAKLLDLSFDLPVVIEIVDHKEKIDEFLETANQMIETSGGGALITIEDVEVVHYQPKKT
jgi:PII-like signaling protein